MTRPARSVPDADLLEVGDSRGAGGVGLVRHGGAGDGRAALAAASLVVEDDGETGGALVAALTQAVVHDADVVLGGQLRHRPPVVGHVHQLLVGGLQAVGRAVAGVAPVVGGEGVLLVQLLLAQHVVQDGPGLVPVAAQLEVELVAARPVALTGRPALSAALLLRIESPGAELEGGAACGLLSVAAEETLGGSLPGLGQVGVAPAVELPLGVAGLPAGAVAEGLQRLVGVDEVLAPGLRGELAP